MPVSETTYHTILLEDPEGHWELVCGRLREEPPITMAHNEMIDALDWQLKPQLSPRDYAIRANRGRVRTIGGSYFEPDLIVVPRELVEAQQPTEVEVFQTSLPLVVEVWSPLTGRYDVQTKLETYRERGDGEIWFVHPYDRTITVRMRQPDGTYDERVQHGGKVRPTTLPNVTADFDALIEQAMR